jgi:serine/threonine protein kinase
MLTPGTRLGAYEIVGTLGAGGMGEVYRATDTKLGRGVAIKVLPEAFAADPDRVPRFERGETLAERLQPGALAIDEALAIAPRSPMRMLKIPEHRPVGHNRGI